MRRILLMVIRNILFVPVYWYKLCYHARHVEKYTEEEHYELLRYIDHRANTSGNINIKVYGQENIPDDNGFMFYPNHQGLYDVLAIMEACPRPFSVVAKKEVANVPFLKQVFACMKAYMIDREDVRQSLQVIVNVSNDVKAEPCAPSSRTSCWISCMRSRRMITSEGLPLPESTLKEPAVPSLTSAAMKFWNRWRT